MGLDCLGALIRDFTVSLFFLGDADLMGKIVYTNADFELGPVLLHMIVK